MKYFLFIVFLISLQLASYSQNMSVQQYIDKYKDLAISEMRRSGVPADITLAQGVLETESGNSILLKRSNNHFGIKCKETWTGESVSHDDDAPGECFRKYKSADESYRDHSDFLRSRPNYASLFTLNPTDYKAWAYGLKKAGYATNPNYPKILIKTIEEYHLNDISKDVAAELPDEKEIPAEIPKAEVAKIQIPTKPVAATPVAKSKFETRNPNATKFNGLNAYYAEPGTSLLAIAENYNIALSTLLDYNDLKSDGIIKEKTWVYLQKKLAEGKRDTYITSGTETVEEIAHVNAIQLTKLLEYNGWREHDRIKIGTIVRLKSSVAGTTAIQEDVNVKTGNTSKTHEVQPKEGLFGISKKYNVSVDQLREWNNLTSDELTVGQQLIISK